MNKKKKDKIVIDNLNSGDDYWKEFWEKAIIPLLKQLVGENSLIADNVVGGKCKLATIKLDDVCYVCPSNFYADCKRDMNGSKDSVWRWIGEKGGCGFLGLGCNAYCADLTETKNSAFHGTLDTMHFGCCGKGNATYKRKKCCETEGNWAWYGIAESNTSNPDFTVGLDILDGLITGMGIGDFSDVTATVKGNKTTLKVDKQILTSKLGSKGLVGHLTGLGCSVDWTTGWEKSNFEVSLEVDIICQPESGSKKNRYLIDKIAITGLKVQDLKLTALAVGECWPGTCYATGVCEIFEILIPTLGDLILQIMKDNFINNTVFPLITSILQDKINEIIPPLELPFYECKLPQ